MTNPQLPSQYHIPTTENALHCKHLYRIPPRLGRYIVLDTETTGLNHDDHVVELGAHEIINGKLTGAQFHIYIRPRIKMSEEVIKIHGITNPPFNLYTKDNYNFFNVVKNKENFRLNYAIKYLRDTLVKGNNLFIIVLPCEYKYLLLVHDLLNNIKMRRLIVENILLSDDEEENTNQLGEIYKFENVSELNIDINDMNDNGSFQSFSKNNSIITNVSSAFDGKGKNIWNMSYYENKTTEVKNKRKEINYERLRKIDDKNNIIKLFDILDKLSLQDLKLYE